MPLHGERLRRPRTSAARVRLPRIARFRAAGTNGRYGIVRRVVAFWTSHVSRRSTFRLGQRALHLQSQQRR
jgi:hypothetical protein